MANPLARVMMDQMSKKNGKINAENCGEPMERLSNLGKREEAIISSVIHKTQGTMEVGKPSGKPNFQGKKVQLQDLVKNTSVTENQGMETSRQNENPRLEKHRDHQVKNPYQKKEVKASVVANPGKGVSAVSLKSLGKGNTL